MVPNLTTGAILEIMQGAKVNNPVLQVLGCKKIASAGNSDRHRLCVSDGKYSSSFAMLTTQLNFHVEQGDLEKYTVIRLNNYVCNQLSPEKRVLIILELNIVASANEVGDKIGNPVILTGLPGQDTNVSNSSTVQCQNVNPNIGHQANIPISPKKCLPPQNLFTKQFPSSAPSAIVTRNVHSIASLTPYQNKWTIRARVTSKSAIRSWSNSRGEGTLFSMDLLDESGEIRCTAFKEQCKKFHPIIEPTKVYYISRGLLKPANKAFSGLKHDYELTLTNESVIEPCDDSTGEIPMLQFTFVPISNLQQIEKDTIVDVIGVCKGASDLQTLMSRTTHRELKKREVHLVDQTNTAVTLTLWGEQAESFDASGTPVVAVKGVKVSDFGGCSLSTVMSSLVVVDPQIEEAKSIRAWYQMEGHSQEVASLSKAGGAGGFATNWKYLKDTHNNSLNCSDKPVYYTVKAVITLVKKENCLYMACPNGDCNKKVVDMNNGLYRCEKCNNQFNEFKWRLLLLISISDFTNNLWVTCFQDSAEAILGITAEKLGQLKDTDTSGYLRAIDGPIFKEFIFKLRSKIEIFQDEQRMKTMAVAVTPINYIEYSKKLIEDLKRMI